MEVSDDKYEEECKRCFVNAGILGLAGDSLL